MPCCWGAGLTRMPWALRCIQQEPRLHLLPSSGQRRSHRMAQVERRHPRGQVLALSGHSVGDACSRAVSRLPGCGSRAAFPIPCSCLRVSPAGVGAAVLPGGEQTLPGEGVTQPWACVSLGGRRLHPTGSTDTCPTCRLCACTSLGDPGCLHPAGRPRVYASLGDPGHVCHRGSSSASPRLRRSPPGERLRVSGGRGGVQLGRRARLLSTNRETPSPGAGGSAPHLYARVENRVCVGGQAAKYRAGYLGCSHACSEDSSSAGCKEIITEYTLSLSARNAGSPRRKTSHSKLLLIPFFCFILFLFSDVAFDLVSAQELYRAAEHQKGSRRGRMGQGTLRCCLPPPKASVGQGWGQPPLWLWQELGAAQGKAIPAALLPDGTRGQWSLFMVPHRGGLALPKAGSPFEGQW